MEYSVRSELTSILFCSFCLVKLIVGGKSIVIILIIHKMPQILHVQAFSPLFLVRWQKWWPSLNFLFSGRARYILCCSGAPLSGNLWFIQMKLGAVDNCVLANSHSRSTMLYPHLQMWFFYSY